MSCIGEVRVVVGHEILRVEVELLVLDRAVCILLKCILLCGFDYVRTVTC